MTVWKQTGLLFLPCFVFFCRFTSKIRCHKFWQKITNEKKYPEGSRDLSGDIVPIQTACSPNRKTVSVGLELLSAGAAGPQGSKVKAFRGTDQGRDAASASKSFFFFPNFKSRSARCSSLPPSPTCPWLVCPGCSEKVPELHPGERESLEESGIRVGRRRWDDAKFQKQFAANDCHHSINNTIERFKR